MNLSSLVGHVTELCSLLDSRHGPADLLAADFFRERRYLGSHDRRFISDSLFGIVRHRRFLETILEGFEDAHPDAAFQDPSSRFLALYIIYAATILGDPGERIAETLGTRWKVHQARTDINHFLRWVSEHRNPVSYHHDPLIRLGIEFSFQDWMVSALKRRFGEGTRGALAALNDPAPTTIRVNVLKTNRESCRERLRTEGIDSSFTAYSPAGLTLTKRFNRNNSQAFSEGWFELQDEGSQLISLLVDPKPGMVVIDACAGTGGKSLHLAELMNDEGEVIAIDSERRRLSELQNRMRRSGVRSVRTSVLREVRAGDLSSMADIVLVDAPCSGSGTIRRNPSLKWETTESKVLAYSERQLDILNFNSTFVKPGGMLVYVTCSILHEEDEDVVEKFLMGNETFSVLDAAERARSYGLEPEGHYVLLTPHHHGTDGFFAAFLKRRSA